MIAAWGIICGGGYSSFFGQLTNVGPRDISGLPSSWVAIIKGFLLSVALASLFLSVRRLGLGRSAIPRPHTQD
jgi:hypothetical protein